MAESVWRVRVIGTKSGSDRYLQTHHFDASGGGDVADLADIVDQYLQGLKLQQTTDIKSRRDSTIQKIDVSSGDIISEATVGGLEVTGTKTQLPEWTVKNGLIAWKSPVFIDGRRLVGRSFIWGVPGDAGEQQPGSGYISALQAAAEDLITNSQTANLALQCLRRPRLLEGGGGLAPGASEDATSATTRSYWAVLKSRR